MTNNNPKQRIKSKKVTVINNPKLINKQNKILNSHKLT